MSYHHGWVYWVNALGDATEFVNHARTAAYLTTLDCFSGVSDVLDYGGCQAYAFAPCIEDATTLAVTTWQPYGFTVPSDESEPAPWWDGVPFSASSEAIGMIIEEMTGLDGAQHSRGISPVGGRRGGSRFGPLGNTHRTIKMNMLIMGTTERSLEYLFRWIEDQLMSCCGPTCTDMSMWIRTFCTDIDNIEDGVYRLYDVALLEGPSWEAPPVESRDGSWMRRISFSVGTGDPCMYSPNSVVSTGTLDISNIIATNANFMPFPVLHSKPISCIAPCDSFTGLERLLVGINTAVVGQTAPVVRIRTSAAGGCPELRIVGLEDVHGYGSLTNSCTGRVTGQIELARLPANAELTIDFGRRTITYSDSTTNGEVPGWAFVTPSTGSRKRWASFARCDTAYTLVELNSRCYDGVTTPGTIYDDTGAVMTFADPTIDIWYVSRIGCC